MHIRILTILILLLLCAAAVASPRQSAKTPPPPPPQTPKPSKPVKDKVTVSPSYNEEDRAQVEPVNLKLAKGGKVVISSRSGQIFVSGWDKDTVQANATDSSGAVQIETQTAGDPAHPRLLLSIARRFNREAKFEVKVPRYADVETLDGYRGDVNISDLEGASIIAAGNGDVKIVRVGSAKVSRRSGDVTIRDVKGDLTARTYNGDVVVENVGGGVDIAATSGDLRIHSVGGDVRANSATGDIEVRCGKGRAEVSSASGSIVMIGVGGDIDASTGSGDVEFTGPMHTGGNYRLKSLSGAVSMTIQPDVKGFTATLTTYSGEIETAFPLKVESPMQGPPINRRVIGTFGDGQGKIALDSFSGSVKIAKGTGALMKECK